MVTERKSPSGRESLRIVDVVVDFASVPAASAPSQVAPVITANVGDAVIATPLGTWPAGLGMMPHQVLVDETVQVRLVNPTVGAVDPGSQTVRFALFRPLPIGADRSSPSGPVQKVSRIATFAIASVAARTSVDQAVAVPGALIGDTIIVTPLGFFNPGMLLGPHRCLVDGTVQVRVTNVSTSAVDQASQAYNFELYRNTPESHPDRQGPSGREVRRDSAVVIDVPSLPASNSVDLEILVPKSKIGDSVILTPRVALYEAGIGFGPHRVFADGTVTTRIGNATLAPIDPASRLYNYTLIRNFGAGGVGPPTPPSPGALNLGTAGTFTGLAQSGITNVPMSAITGNIGVSPAAAASITGFALVLDGGGQFSTSAQVTGQVFAADYVAPTPANLTAAVSAANAAYTDAQGRTPNFTELAGGLIGGLTLVPGVYKWSTAVTIATSITLQGSATDIWIFQVAGVFTLANAQQIILSGGALARNVFFAVAGNAVLGTTSLFQGVLLCATGIAMQNGATAVARFFPQTALTLISNTIVPPP